MGDHINADGQFQSDKYPTCPPGKVPLSVEDKTAQDLLWRYAQRRRAVDPGFAADLETALRQEGYEPVDATTINVDDMLATFHVVARRFRAYEIGHRRKGTPEDLEKAEANRRMAEMCEAQIIAAVKS